MPVQTRILVTNVFSYLPYCDQVVLMEDGKIAANGHFDEVAKNSSLFDRIKRHRAEKEPGKNLNVS